jgi:hypothetical protein
MGFESREKPCCVIWAVRLGCAIFLWLTCCGVWAQGPRLIVQRVLLAGFTYHAAAEVWNQLHEGEMLRLVREADNPYDALAVRVDWQGPGRAYTLGYLPRTANAAVAQALDAHVQLEARISHLRETPNPRRRIEVEIALRPPFVQRAGP